MGREVRRVPPDWEHPRGHRYDPQRYKPLFDGFNTAVAAFQNDIDRVGLVAALHENAGAPNPEDYMPDWPAEERTHYQMYETTSEGTPISPVMDSPEALARWLADNKASAFADQTATYEEWLYVARGGYAPSAVSYGGSLVSGVAGMAALDRKE